MCVKLKRSERAGICHPVTKVVFSPLRPQLWRALPLHLCSYDGASVPTDHRPTCRSLSALHGSHRPSIRVSIFSSQAQLLTSKDQSSPARKLSQGNQSFHRHISYPSIIHPSLPVKSTRFSIHHGEKKGKKNSPTDHAPSHRTSPKQNPHLHLNSLPRTRLQTPPFRPNPKIPPSFSFLKVLIHRNPRPAAPRPDSHETSPPLPSRQHMATPCSNKGPHTALSVCRILNFRARVSIYLCRWRIPNMPSTLLTHVHTWHFPSRVR